MKPIYAATIVLMAFAVGEYVNVKSNRGQAGGGDISMYQQHIPGFYYKIGARPSQGHVYPHHNEIFPYKS